MADAKQPLISYQSSNPNVCLYNDECILSIDIDKAKGFLVLLQQKELAFSALTDGNILDACLGAQPLRRSGERYLLTREAKNALITTSESSESFPELAVATYKKSMEIVVNHHEKIQKIWICCRCFLSNQVRRRSKRNLKDAFKVLEEAIQVSSS